MGSIFPHLNANPLTTRKKPKKAYLEDNTTRAYSGQLCIQLGEQSGSHFIGSWERQ